MLLSEAAALLMKWLGSPESARSPGPASSSAPTLSRTAGHLSVSPSMLPGWCTGCTQRRWSSALQLPPSGWALREVSVKLPERGEGRICTALVWSHCFPSLLPRLTLAQSFVPGAGKKQAAFLCCFSPAKQMHRKSKPRPPASVWTHPGPQL